MTDRRHFIALFRLRVWTSLIAILLATSVLGAPKENYIPGRILIMPKAGLASTKGHVKKGHKLKRRLPHTGIDVVELPSGSNPETEARAYRDSGLVEFAEPDYLLRASVIPNDPAFRKSEFWSLNNTGALGGRADADIDAPEAWNAITSAEQIIVAVIDTGIRVTHEDLAPNIWINSRERPNGLDDDKNGVIDDLHGFNAPDWSGDPRDDNGHGTHVAGTIGARGNNGFGLAGVAWNVKLMALKFLTADGGGATSDAIACIEYAVKNGARIINASWGGPDYSYALERAIRVAGNSGVIFVAAAGNEAANNDYAPSYPANFAGQNILSVAATTKYDTLDSAYSNYGLRTVDLAAPGSGILSTWHQADDAYMVLNGTSMATPHVSGALALLRARFPNDSVTTLIQRLLAATDKLTSLTGKVASGGRLNLANLFPKTFELTTNVIGTGSIQLNPLQNFFTNGSVVRVTAVPAGNHEFVRWEGAATSTVNPLALTISTNTTLTAVFSPIVTATPPPAILGKPQIQDGHLLFRVANAPGIIVEFSPDLLNWNPLVLEPEPHSETESIIRISREEFGPIAFFRVRPEPGTPE